LQEKENKFFILTGTKQNIVYLKNEEINKAKWDNCIKNSSNGLIYGYSFYLDAMSKHWDGLVMNDYEAVMPLTWNRKYGIYYLYQPFFTASLGVFGNNLSAGVVKDFLESVPSQFKYWDIYLNKDNLFQIPPFKLYQRTNYTLSLDNPYKVIASRFSENHLRNIKRAVKAGCTVQKNIPVKDVIALAKKQSETYASISNTDYKNFEKLFEYLFSKNKAVTYAVYTGKELMSAAVYLFSHNRAYYILAGNHPKSKTIGASHFLINAFIEEHAGEDLILDFEGSDIKSLANFYSKFGATEEKYAAIKMNKLPAVLKLFRK